MNSYIRNQYKQFLVEYLKQECKIELKNIKKEFKCPVCQTDESATIYPNNTSKFFCASPECDFKEGDIFDLVRKTKNLKFQDQDVAHYLQHKFKIPIVDDIKDLLNLYSKNNFCMFPLEPGSKNPQKGFLWTEKEYRDPKIWNDWVDRGYGLAIRLGKVSKVIAIDIDSDETYKKMKDLLGEDTLIQSTKKGRHFLYTYEDCFDFIKHVNLRNKGYDMEIRANNAYIAVAPTSTDGEIRKWNNKKICKMSAKLKKFFLDLIDKDTKSVDEEMQEAIDKNDLGIKNGLTGLDGECNDTFMKLGGILRKQMSIDQTRYALGHFNQLLADPMDKKSINNMVRQLDKYKTYDKQELAEEVIKRLEVIKEATAFQIASSLKKDQKDVEDVLKYLEDEDRILSLSNRKYKLLEQVEWTSEKEDLSIPIDFQMPYFHDFARFYQGGMIILGSPTGHGKSHITGNIIKKLWEQKRVTHLINTEPEGGIEKITHSLGLPPEAYVIPKKSIIHPSDIELVDNAITIIDWLRIKDGDFSKTGNTFNHFRQQLAKHKGFLIIFTQIRKSNYDWFAPDQIEEFASLACKYLWGNNGVDGENTYFLTTKIRDSKTKQQFITIPTYFDSETKLLEIRK